MGREMNQMTIQNLLKRANTLAPIERMLALTRQTKIEHLFQFGQIQFDKNMPFILDVTGMSGAGKDTLLEPLMHSEKIEKVQSVTSRPRRVGEAYEAYIWVRGRKSDESLQMYIEEMIQKYDLVECTYKFETLYGLPRKSLMLASLYANEHHSVPVIKNNVEAIAPIREKLEGKIQLITVCVITNSYMPLLTRIQGRGSDEQLLDRFWEAVETIKNCPGNIDFIFLNPQIPENPQEAIRQACASFAEFINKIAEKELDDLIIVSSI